MIAVDMPGARALVYRDVEVGAGLLRRGRGRGVSVVLQLPPWRRSTADDLARVVDEVETRDDWHDNGRELAAWARSGGWGEIDGDSFDRALLRRTMRAHRWSEIGPYAVVQHNWGKCLVLRGRHGARLLLMSGDNVHARRLCTGPALVGGVLS